MRIFLITLGIIVGIIVLAVVGFFGYAYFKIKKSTVDSHDLQAQVDTLCNKYISNGKAPGLLVAIVQDETVYIQGYGVIDKDSKVKPDSNTIFEIGSISKVFTSEIAQLLVEEKQINWSDNISMYMPAGVKLPAPDSTTLEHLSTHMSGFPRLPELWFPKLEENECDPYSTLTVQDLHHYLNNSTDKKKPEPNNYDYSNIGAGLLGHILEWKTGKDYETLLQEYICGPLQMKSTATVAIDSSRFATGYDEKGNKTCHWKMPIIGGAGVIKSTGADMVRFLKANMSNTTPVSPAFIKTQQKIADIPTGSIGHGWHIDKLNGVLARIPAIVWHNGGTGGFRTYIGFVPGTTRGVVVLANQSHDDLDGLAIDILKKVRHVSFK